MKTALVIWIWAAAYINCAGWVLSALHELTPAGYAGALLIGLVALAIWWKKSSENSSFRIRRTGFLRRFRRPLPAIFLFGYGYDPTFFELTGARLRKGLLQAEERLVEEATVDGRTVAEHKKFLQKRYREKLAEIAVKGDT